MIEMWSLHRAHRQTASRKTVDILKLVDPRPQTKQQNTPLLSKVLVHFSDSATILIVCSPRRLDCARGLLWIHFDAVVELQLEHDLVRFF